MTAPDELDAAEASAASEGQRLMISQRMQGSGTSQTGTWVAAGAIDDEGTASVAQIQGTPQDGTLLIEATHVLVSGDGTIELRDRTILQPFPPPEPQHRVLFEGRWRLASGTGAYANLRARGRLYGTGTDRVGVGREITLVRDGRARERRVREP